MAPIFESLLEPLPTTADEVDKQEALAQRAADYYRFAVGRGDGKHGCRAPHAAKLIQEVCLTSPYVFLDRPVPVLPKQTILQDYVAMHLKCRPYVFDCKYEKPFETDVHFRVAPLSESTEFYRLRSCIVAWGRSTEAFIRP